MVPGLQEVVLQRLPYKEAVGVARAVTDGEQDPEEEGVRRHLLQDVPHLHLLLALPFGSLDLGRIDRLVLHLTVLFLLVWKRVSM